MDKHYTVAEIANIKDVSIKTVYNWVERGLKCYEQRIKGRRRMVLLLVDVENFLDDGIKEVVRDGSTRKADC